ncbi:hypothetical protein COY07_00805 [Candidatus Peregrinibacteria bacterium CG_4_10_14_0_2_um_filter_43_11]|nr:MAG: hypothetical protein COY07_00805 [Candidatus Peregrinibacteria bacterium CG_4_10_14_0_2_um_filter_43_11]
MIRKSFLISIGILLFSTLLWSESSYAAFCDTEGALETTYHSVYCDAAKSYDEDIYDIVAVQFDIEDAINDKGVFLKSDIVRGILNLEPIDIDTLPESLRLAYELKGRPDVGISVLTQNILAAYEKEKTLHHIREGMKREFSASEKWYNADSSDSPFDLIDDLNVIEIILFGSQAQWKDDIYKFPVKDDKKASGSSAGDTGESDTTNSSNPSGGVQNEQQGSAEGSTPSAQPECLPADDPNADVPDSNPSTASILGVIPPLCGNSVLDQGEACDDGNNKAGDGCAPDCKLEDIGSLQCFDPEAVTFTSFSSNPQKGDSDSSNNSSSSASSTTESTGSTESTSPSSGENACPPGTYPPKPGDVGQPQVPQSPKYPGPFVGGVLKAFAPGKRPPCPPGESEISITAMGQKTSACVATELCGDFDATRDFLFGKGWQDDEEKSKIALSIEALFCVNVKKENRPESPYALNEHCIDCHIRGMVDALDQMLQKNVAPLENTQSAFAISNRWGPSVSFNLNVAVKSKTKLSDLAKPFSDAGKANEKEKKDRQKRANKVDENNEVAQPTVIRTADLNKILTEYNNFKEQKDQAYFESLKNYRLNSDAESEVQFAGRILPLLEQWRSSFEKIQNVFVSMYQTSKFREKKECEF